MRTRRKVRQAAQRICQTTVADCGQTRDLPGANRISTFKLQLQGQTVSGKKLKNESELVKKAIDLGVKYGEARGVVEFEPTDSASEKILYIYRLLVHDQVIQPIPEDQVSQKAMRHKLAIWASRQD